MRNGENLTNLLLNIIILVKDKGFLKIEPNPNSVRSNNKIPGSTYSKYLFLANKNNLALDKNRQS